MKFLQRKCEKRTTALPHCHYDTTILTTAQLYQLLCAWNPRENINSKKLVKSFVRYFDNNVLT